MRVNEVMRERVERLVMLVGLVGAAVLTLVRVAMPL